MGKDVLGEIERMSGGKKVEPKKRGLSTAGKIGIAAAVGIAAFEGAGIGYDAVKYTGDQALPISTMAEHPFGIGLPPRVEVIPSTFDPAAINSVIGPENSIQMTWDQYEATSPTLWNADSKTMTIPLPISFNENQIPTLHTEKGKFSYDSSISAPKQKITIDGLQQGSIIFSPTDGEIVISLGNQDLNAFYISTKDSQGNPINIWFSTTGLNPMVNFDSPIKDTIHIPIKKGDPIGSLLTSDKHRMFNGQIQIDGIAPLLENFNLATTPEGKAIEITK
jgi:hypothetical protein